MANYTAHRITVSMLLGRIEALERRMHSLETTSPNQLAPAVGFEITPSLQNGQSIPYDRKPLKSK